MHRPLWDHRPTRWDERVQPLLARHGVDFVIAGHYHSLQMLPPRDGIPYLIVGTCGGAVDQHPLAGQLQHLTHLVIDETGGIHPYHQIAGTTLPIDWILKADQDLAYRLKSDKGGVEIRGALPDPLGAPSAGAIELVVRNPLDRPIEARLAAAAEPSPWSVVDRDAGQPIERTWASRTPVDVFNPSTTDLASPFALALPADTTSIAPGASATFRIEASCEPQATPPLPPPFDLVLAFPDSKGRAVPIHLRQRVPIARAVRIGASLEAAVEYPIAVWKWSEYDTLEENARARFAAPAPSDAVSGATPGDAAPIALEIAIETSDRVLSDDARPSDRASSLEDPLGDALRLVLGEDAEAREFLVTFADGAPRVRTVGADGSSLVPTTDVSGTVLAGKEGSRRIVLQVRGSALPEGARLEGLPVNLGVADNDETYHTQWRWLAPREIPARLTRE